MCRIHRACIAKKDAAGTMALLNVATMKYMLHELDSAAIKVMTFLSNTTLVSLLSDASGEHGPSSRRTSIYLCAHHQQSQGDSCAVRAPCAVGWKSYVTAMMMRHCCRLRHAGAPHNIDEGFALLWAGVSMAEFGGTPAQWIKQLGREMGTE
jgi:hypothetical protein